MLRMTVGGEKLSAEMLLLLALVTCDSYLLFPSAEERAAIDLGLLQAAAGRR
jgi:hypothetical protein